MKLQKTLALMTCLTALFLLPACKDPGRSGSRISFSESTVSPSVPVTDTTWKDFIVARDTLDRMIGALSESLSDSAADVQDMLIFNDALAQSVREDFTEGNALDALQQIYRYLDLLKPDVDIADDGTITPKA